MELKKIEKYTKEKDSCLHDQCHFLDFEQKPRLARSLDDACAKYVLLSPVPISYA